MADDLYQMAPPLSISGEYGATSVALTRDGSCYRLAFGRSQYDHAGNRASALFHGAVILSPEAMEDLIRQLSALGIR
ncbi:hypothetical protein [Rhodobacter capsulatus]|jgi:hypothetical protein|uniref:Uncharacterized protein n=1 Tax=Rhodobacter phage RcapNL TaxID=1131316 RepID=H6WBQ2_9CAUD|nr:hypothetical protein [Rhodobacter capsulatus]YP_007518431.1 hypothetical protein I920_gp49 [Rhodobacter phage RcapNL]AFK66553.1 hypothetical protein RHZG_00047 [Rhodobacter phage RcNL1]AFA44889.1 hypothetical protein RcapNL_00049 [Rhodobacter phage RcapNL]ETD02904.1 hypothetical protein U714_04345 [Rhodobacter capsulatus DE442]ETD79059.1 hypothetical protein U717_04350 [Rhodobacter capsulatus R121]ETE54974.1 hypothetical protein U715_04340 [Rhodobacter capsulatus Y262]